MERNTCAIILAWVLFLISEGFAFLIHKNLSGFLDHKFKISPRPDSDKWRSEAILLACSIVIINGHGMVLFRILPSCRTPTLKYIHLLIHTYVLIGSGRGFYVMNDLEPVTFNKLQTLLLAVYAVLYVFEYISSIFVYLYMYTNQLTRKKFASIHNFIGICIHQIAIMAICITVQEDNLLLSESSIQAGYVMLSLVVYGVLINAIVLNPYLEWRMNGPL